MGFGIPQGEWIRGGLWEMTNDLLTDQVATNRNWFNPIEINRLLALHKSGEDKDRVLWPMLMLELWARTWLD
jgi:asparagine synthase (glutamine-hydrolysing)